MDDTSSVDWIHYRAPAGQHFERPIVCRYSGNTIVVQPWQDVEPDSRFIAKDKIIPATVSAGVFHVTSSNEQNVALLNVESLMFQSAF